MRRLQYLDYGQNKDRCLHVVLSDRAYASILSEVMKNGDNETGGVLLGTIYKNIWYVVESVDPGLVTTNTQDFFRWDAEYVNHLLDKLCPIYRFMISIVGFWHRHPGSMDFFSSTDENTIRSNLKNSKYGLLSMLVNIDPKLRMTFYYCWQETLTRVKYDVGDEYFPVELLEYAKPDGIAEKNGIPESKRFEILPNKVYSSARFPKTVFPGKKPQGANPDTEQPAAQMENYRETIDRLQKENTELKNAAAERNAEKQALEEEIKNLKATIDELREEDKVSQRPDEIQVLSTAEEAADHNDDPPKEMCPSGTEIAGAAPETAEKETVSEETEPADNETLNEESEPADNGSDSEENASE